MTLLLQVLNHLSAVEFAREIERSLFVGVLVVDRAPLFDEYLAHFEVTFPGGIEQRRLLLETIDDVDDGPKFNHFLGH